MNQNILTRIGSVVLLAGVLLALTGCGSPYGSSVTGVVTMGDKPLSMGTITFHPVGDGAASYGLIFPDGTFSLNTGRASGLAPGDYIATVVATEMLPPAKPGGLPIGKLITPARYGDKSKSELRFTVVPGKNHFELQLDAK